MEEKRNEVKKKSKKKAHINLKFKVNKFNDLENFVFKEVAVAVALVIMMVRLMLSKKKCKNNNNKRIVCT